MAIPASALSRPSLRLAPRTLPPPVEEDSLLRDAGQGLLSGLGWIGESLTKPSRALWGGANYLTGGNSGGGLLNLIPFSDTLGLTDPRKGIELSGFLENAGAIPQNTPGFDAWDIPRLGLDIAGDPLSYVTGLGFGKALGKGGQALSRANVLDDLVKGSGKGAREYLSSTTARQALQGLDRTQLRSVRNAAQGLGFDGLADMARKSSGPIGGQLGLNLPFGSPLSTMGSPKIGRALDKVGEAARWNPVSREGFRMFSSGVRGGRTRPEQEFGKFLTKLGRSGEKGVDRFALRLVDELKRISPELMTPKGQRHLMNMVEGVADSVPEEFAQELSRPARGIGDMLGRFLKEAQEAGGKVQGLDDVLEYFPRQIRGKVRDRVPDDLLDPDEALSAFTGSSLARAGYLRDIESGTQALEDLFNKDLMHVIESGAKRSEIEDWMRNWNDVNGNPIPEEYVVRDANGAPMTQTTEGTLNELIERRTDELLEQRRAEIDYNHESAEVDIAFRKRHSDLVNALRRNPELHPQNIHRRFDEVFEEYQSASGRMDVTEEDVIEVLSTPNPTKPRLTRADVEVEAKALAADDFSRMTIDEEAPLMGNRFEKLARLAQRSYKEAPERFTEGLFEDPMDSLYGYMQGMSRVITTGKSVTEALKDPRFMSDALQLADGEQGITISRLLQDMKLNGDKVAENVLGATSKKAIAKFKSQKVSDSVARRVLKMGGFGRTPEDISLVEKLWNFQNNLFKASVTAPFPGFHGRNFVGAQIQNIITGLLRPSRALAENRNSHRLLTGQVVPDAHQIPVIRRTLQEQGLEVNAENGTEALRQLLAENQVWSPHETIGMGTDVVGAGTDPTSLQRLSSRKPGESPLFAPGPLSPLKDISRKFIGIGDSATLDPRTAQMRGGWTGAETSTFGPFAAGELAGTWIEGQNRIPAFMDQIRRGIDPDVAARNVADAQVSYAARDFTDIERSIKQVVPFYSFGSRMSKFVAGEILNRPGGPMAQVVKQQTRVGQDDENIPPHLRGALSVPLGQSPDGTDRYLSSLGLMHEGSFLNALTARGGVPDFGETGAQVLASTSPAIKGPLEAITGESFFQRGPLGGRDLNSMDPPIGGTFANIGQLAGGERPYPADPFIGRGLEQIAANSPLSRAITTARTLTDKRKFGPEMAMQLLTGLNITDVSPQQRERILRDRLAATMKEAGAASFTSIRFTSQQIDAASPEEAAAMRQFNALANRVQREQSAARKARTTDSSVRLRPVSVTQ